MQSFLTHVQGFDGLTDELINKLKEKNIPLIEDVCESHGTTHNGQEGWEYWMDIELFFLLCTSYEYH